MPKLTREIIDDLAPGVRDLVVFLNEQGFETCDSGDGTNYREGMECAVDYPMIAIQVDPPTGLIAIADMLALLLQERGVDFGKMIKRSEEKGADYQTVMKLVIPQIQASYDPHDGVGVIVLTNVLSKDVRL